MEPLLIRSLTPVDGWLVEPFAGIRGMHVSCESRFHVPTLESTMASKLAPEGTAIHSAAAQGIFVVARGWEDSRGDGGRGGTVKVVLSGRPVSIAAATSA